MSLIAPMPGETIVDATIGQAGHARLFAEAIGPSGHLIGFDVDPVNLETARERLAGTNEAGSPKMDLLRANFVEMPDKLASLGIAKANVILADLGVTTGQLLDPQMGITFSEDGPLDMRLDDRLETTAADLVNAMPENDLANLIFENSQERFSRRIAKRICQVRRDGRIRRTGELVRIICSALGVAPNSHRSKIHPATRTFQALRMAVNYEVENLQGLLKHSPDLLAVGGRIAVISFHSGEDRIVKQDFLDRKRSGVYEIVTKKPIRATSEEIRANPRSRSAKLRVAKRLGGDPEPAAA